MCDGAARSQPQNHPAFDILERTFGRPTLQRFLEIQFHEGNVPTGKNGYQRLGAAVDIPADP